HGALAASAGEYARALRDGLVDPRLDALRGALVDHRSDVDAFVERVADAARLDLRDELRDERSFHAAMHEDALHADAVLAAVDDAAAHAARGGVVEVCVFGDDHRAVAAELERDLLASGDVLDVPADLRAAGEAHHRESLVAHHLLGERHRAVADL